MTQQLLDQLYGHLTTFVAGAAAIAIAFLDAETRQKLGLPLDEALMLAGFATLGLQTVGVLPR